MPSEVSIRWRSNNAWNKESSWHLEEFKCNSTKIISKIKYCPYCGVKLGDE